MKKAWSYYLILSFNLVKNRQKARKEAIKFMSKQTRSLSFLFYPFSTVILEISILFRSLSS